MIIVTANGEHFIWEIKKYQSRLMGNECHELHGLVILPSGWEHQRRLLKHIEDKLRIDGKSITWADVAEHNSCVRLKRNGPPDVRREFRPCLYCEKQRAQ